MEKLSLNILKEINSSIIDVPPPSNFDLPERVIQFGTGVLLRGLPDYFIDKANRKGLFNGRIVVVKSTSNGDTSSFIEQNNLYTFCARGMYKGKEEVENIINGSISRVVSAIDDWNEILRCASNPDLQIIISNTTEVGIKLVEDNVFNSPPSSFPGKLVSFLYERFKFFHGDITRGMVIIPTELIPDNGDKLRSIVFELSHRNRLGTKFIDWLENGNYFCNSLVDRIVPGKPNSTLKRKVETEAKYVDDLIIMSEAYRLWAIETPSEKVNRILSFSKVDEGVVLTYDIAIYRELKLRLLNGTHTFCCALAFLGGFSTVQEAMNNNLFSKFVYQMMTGEIVQAIISKDIPAESANEFALNTIDRFKNPAIEHQWLSISAQYTSKMMMRCVPVLRQYIETANKVPELMSLGFAAYIVFMKPSKHEAGILYGKNREEYYIINDAHADRIAEIWDGGSDNIVEELFGDISIWKTNLNDLPELTESVQNKVNRLLSENILQIVQDLVMK